jgi:hypothetical protein
MVRSIEHYPSETIVVVHAKLRKAHTRVKNATLHDHELEVYEVHKVGNLSENVPFTVYDAENINRDKEDVDDDDDDESGIISGTDTPDGPSRASTDLSKLSLDNPKSPIHRIKASEDKLASRSTLYSSYDITLLTRNSQYG